VQTKISDKRCPGKKQVILLSQIPRSIFTQFVLETKLNKQSGVKAGFSEGRGGLPRRAEEDLYVSPSNCFR